MGGSSEGRDISQRGRWGLRRWRWQGDGFPLGAMRKKKEGRSSSNIATFLAKSIKKACTGIWVHALFDEKLKCSTNHHE